LYGPPIARQLNKTRVYRVAPPITAESGFLNSKLFAPWWGFGDTGTRILARSLIASRAFGCLQGLYPKAIRICWLRTCVPPIETELVERHRTSHHETIANFPAQRAAAVTGGTKAPTPPV